MKDFEFYKWEDFAEVRDVRNLSAQEACYKANRKMNKEGKFVASEHGSIWNGCATSSPFYKEAAKFEGLVIQRPIEKPKCDHYWHQVAKYLRAIDNPHTMSLLEHTECPGHCGASLDDES